MTHLHHIADRLLNRPLLIDPAKAEVIFAVLEGRLPISPGAAAEIEQLTPEANRFVGTRAREGRGYGLTRMSGGVAIITVTGSLVNRGAWIGASSGLTSYEGIEAQLRDAANDGDVRAILLDIDSPGGEATGMFRLAETIRAVDKIKPVVAFVNDRAASAAYGIAASARQIAISQTSVLGSIGVVMLHLDRSGELASKGIKPTLIYAGAHKVDGNPFGPLSEAVRSDLQTGVMTMYRLFLEAVAAGRGNRLTADMARATEARVFIGQDAITAGLADRMASLDELLSELSTSAPQGRASSKRSNTLMSENTNQNTITAEAHAAALTAARAEGATAATSRIKAILTHAEAEGRMDMAMSFAFDTDLSAEQAATLLAKSPKAEAKPNTPTIEQRSQGAPEFGATAGDVAPKAAEAAAAKSGWADAFDRTPAKSTH